MSSRQIVSNNPDHRSKLIGLMPTDGHNAYKKSANRASRRSRAERTSYLVATGHLDLEETEHLNKQTTDPANNRSHRVDTAYSSAFTSSPERSNTSYKNKQNISDNVSHKSPSSLLLNKRSNFEQSFLDDLNRTLANSPTIVTNLQSPQSYELQQENSFAPNKKKKSKRRYW